MAATDFIHRQLINAGSRDAVSNMLAGAGIGAAANTAIGVAQGDFNVIGNATSGAMLGAAGGAAARHFGSKYGSGLIAAKAAGEKVGTNFQVGMMTRKVEEPALDFWGKAGDADSLKGFMPQGGAVKAGPKAGADTSSGSKPPPLPNPFPNNPAQPPISGIGTSFSDAKAVVGSSPGGMNSSYGGGKINVTNNTMPKPKASPAPEVSREDEVRRAMQRADEWTAGEKARVAQEKADGKAYHNFLQNHATKAKKNNELPSSSVMRNATTAMSPENSAKFGGMGTAPRPATESYKAGQNLKETIKYNQQRNAQIEEQARAQMYGY